eukprot:scaffold56426_cov22-Tisochrysis_lutea.AAC.1
MPLPIDQHIALYEGLPIALNSLIRNKALQAKVDAHSRTGRYSSGNIPGACNCRLNACILVEKHSDVQLMSLHDKESQAQWCAACALWTLGNHKKITPCLHHRGSLFLPVK